MGRHSSGKSNYAIAGWMWAAILALLVVAALVFGWSALNQANTERSSTAQCPEGEHSLTVWTGQSHVEQAEHLASQYNDETRVVQDSCIKAKVVPMADSAAMDKLKGAATTGDAPTKDVAGVWIPDDPQRVASTFKDAAVGVSDAKAPVVDNATIFALSNGAAVSELASRAGSDFTSFVADTEGAQVVSVDSLARGAASTGSNSNDSTAPAPATKPADSTRPRPAHQATGGSPDAHQMQDVTFVLDTSGSMGLYEGDFTRLDNLRAPIQEAMKGVGATGGSVGLWNYSSPLSPGVTRPYRNNVDIANHDDGSTSSAIVSQLGYGGATHTYESLIAAYSSAVAGAQQSTAPVFKLVLITDGPNDGGNASLSQAIDEIRQLHAQVPVVLNVVSIGGNVDNSAMERITQAGGGSVFTAADSLSVTPSLQKAVHG